MPGVEIYYILYPLDFMIYELSKALFLPMANLRSQTTYFVNLSQINLYKIDNVMQNVILSDYFLILTLISKTENTLMLE